MTAFYFTITTITTVGYGDFSPGTFIEKIVGILIMFVGVMAFSFASGSLANYIQQQDNHSAIFEEKMAILDRLYKENEFPIVLFSKIKKNLKFNYTQDIKSVNKFIEELPHNLRTDLSIYIYEKVYKRVDFLKKRSKAFISWICPQLKPLVTTPKEYVYYEGDEVTKIYFLKNGSCDFVLPKFVNVKYIKVTEGSYFGVIDIVASCFAEDAGSADSNSCSDESSRDSERCSASALENWFNMFLKRSFTVRSDEFEPTEMLQLEKQDLFRMRLEYTEIYDELFSEAFDTLQKTMSIKLYAVEKCQKTLE